MSRFGVLVLVLFFSFSANAREYERRAYKCVIQLEQEDLRHAKTRLGSFGANFYITLTEAEELLLPKMVLTAASTGVDPAEWAILQKRIRSDLEKGAFSFKAHQLTFTGSFKLNFDGVYTLIRALGGKSLADIDDLTLTDPRYDDAVIDSDPFGQFKFSMGSDIVVAPYTSGAHTAFLRRIQAHLPLTEKDGLSFHIQTSCSDESSGVY